MAESGQTFQFLHHGYCQSVAEATKRAVVKKTGFRRLPRRTWQFPLRPYDIRRYWGDGPEPADFYKKDFVVPKEEAEILPNITASECHVTYTVRVARSPFANEGLCFVRPSTIEAAGLGLFLRARRTTIHKGILSCKYFCLSPLMLPNVMLLTCSIQYLYFLASRCILMLRFNFSEGEFICKYATKSSLNASTSRVYAVQTGMSNFYLCLLTSLLKNSISALYIALLYQHPTQAFVLEASTMKG